MPRTKSKSSELAHIIDTAEENLKALIAFADNIAETIETARKYFEILPLINKFHSVTTPQTQPPATDPPTEPDPESSERKDGSTGETPAESVETIEAVKRTRRIKKVVENAKTTEPDSNS